MKKLVAISVLLAGLAAAVFAQDEGKWKVGFLARYVTDMLFVTDMTGKSVETQTGTPDQTKVFGEFNKGTVNWFGNKDNAWHSGPGQRLQLQVTNSGENYDVHLDMTMDGWVNKRHPITFMDLINAAPGDADWYVKGTAGIFDAQIGTAGRGGFVSPQSTWNDWYGWNAICKFGVWRQGGTFMVGDDFRTQPEWGEIVALGIALGDNYKLSLGYRLDAAWAFWDPNTPDAAASKSSINGTFMLNGRISDAIAFDLFYSILGKDDDTLGRPQNFATAGITANYALPTAKYSNIIGAYVGLNIVENLGLSLGYTANFNVFEAGSWHDPADTSGVTNPAKSEVVNFKAPFYSGVDIRLSYSGIDKIGLTFNNNLSFAGVKEELTNDKGFAKDIILGFDETTPYMAYYPSGSSGSSSQDWFHWETELKASFSLVENLGLTLQLGDRLGVVTDKSERSSSGSSSNSTTITTDNEFRIAAFAEYGIGAVSIGTGLQFGVKSKKYDDKTDSTIGGVSSSSTTVATSDVVTFAIPILFKVQF